jgi:hypothetical protein
MTIKIGEKEFTLKYNNKALFKIEKELDLSIVKLFQDVKQLEKVSTIFVIVHSGIVENISFDEFSDLATFEDLGAILPDVIQEITESFNTGSKKK